MFVSSGKRCGRCKQVKPETEFNRLRDGRQHWCRDCFREYFRARGDLHRKQALDAKTKRIARDRTYVAKYLEAHPCIDCGEGDTRVLDFDHLGEKTATVMRLARDEVGLARLSGEIQRCEVRCVNCHRRRTARELGAFRAQAEYPQRESNSRYEIENLAC